MEIFFYQAECGDAARIRFYNALGEPKNILIDSGYERTFNHVLKKEIKELKLNNEKIDLCVISHIHNDHIGGIIKYIKSIHTGELEDIIEKWFYNPPRKYKGIKSRNHTKSISRAVSISQGDDLYYYIDSKGKLLDYDIMNNLKQVEIGNLKLTILSPSEKKLNSLRKKYKSEETSLETIENESISKAVSVKESDYFIKLEDFNLKKWKEDSSVENGSSISILTEYKNKRILWLADSHPSDIVESLKKLGYSKENKIQCDWMKISHHGSAGNNSNDLFELIDCTNYLISANGENRDFLPTKESITRIILNKNRDFNKKHFFYFTYDNPTLRNIFKVDGEMTFKKWNFEVNYNSKKALQFKL
jgi:beta-lactamase superfamily II metal-dependent hydrolase